MSAQLKPTALTAEAYLKLERSATSKSEFHDGQIYAMTGASREHNLITVNITAALHSQLKNRPCESYTSDMRVKALKANNYYYPDIVVVCGAPQFEEVAFMDTLTNPTVLVEVLSPSTEAYDRGVKFARYRKIETLQEYLLVSQNRPTIEHYLRQSDVWQFTEISGLAAIVSLPSIGCTLSLGEVYGKVLDDWEEVLEL